MHGVPSGWLGVVGGMGPLATADFLAKLTASTPARFDQQHIPVLLYGDCATPDRTAHVLGQGPSPLPQLLAAVSFLDAAGVSAIAVPCNSAHCWYDEMAAAARAPLLHIVDASARQVRVGCPAARSVGVLSTEGTARMGIYASRLQALGLSPLAPNADEFATLVTPGIADVKAGDLTAAADKFERAAAALFARGAEAIILGCTEIPLGMGEPLRRDPLRFIDSTQALVNAVLARMRPAAA